MFGLWRKEDRRCHVTQLSGSGGGRWIKGQINGCGCWVSVRFVRSMCELYMCRHTARFIPPSSRCRHRNIPFSVSCHDPPPDVAESSGKLHGAEEGRLPASQTSHLIYQSLTFCQSPSDFPSSSLTSSITQSSCTVYVYNHLLHTFPPYPPSSPFTSPVSFLILLVN